MKQPTHAPGPQDRNLDRLLLAILNDNLSDATELIRKDAELPTALVKEARLYQTKIMHWLYAKDTALHLAAAGHRVMLAQLFLTAGADPNSAHNHRLGRPLHYAADGYLQNPSFDPPQQVKMIRCLLDAGAEIDAADKNGATPLHRAVRTRCAAAVDCLLEAGADPKARNHSGATPFHLAVQNTGRGGSGHEAAKIAQQQIIESMLAHRISPTMKDVRGKTVLAWARSDWVKQCLAGRD